MLTGNAIKTSGSAALQMLVFFGGLALLWFGGSRTASSKSYGASASAENVPVVVLPFEYFKNHIFVTLQIDNSGQYSCEVDNGFQDDEISAHVARAMGLQSRDVGGKAKGFGEGIGPEIFVAEKSVVLGVPGVPILTGQILVLDMSEMEKVMGRPIDCTIGAPLFARFVVEIDFAKRQIKLYRPHNFVYRGEGHSVRLKIGAPATVQAHVFTPDGRKVEATVGLDLGSDEAFAFQPMFQSKHHILQSEQPKVSVDAMGLEGELQESMVRLPSVDFAGFKIEKPLVEFLDMPVDPGFSSRKEDGTVGNALLQRFTVIFDYPHHRLILEPNSSFGDPFTANMTGVGADPYSDPSRGFEVSFVGSVAAAAGVRAGDRIVEINGVLCSTLTFESFHQMLTAEGAVFTLKVERGDQKIEVRFQTPRLP
jgi:PDZ domain